MLSFTKLVTLAIATLSGLTLAYDTTTSNNPTFALRAWPYNIANRTLAGYYSIDTIRMNALLSASWKEDVLPYFEIANYEDFAVVYFYLNESSSLVAWGNAPVQMPSNWSLPVNYGTTQEGSTGFRFEEASEKYPYMHLVWGDKEEEGTFYTCWQDGNIYGPSLYYRDASCVTPPQCVDVLLLPQCTPQNPLAKTATPVNATCYVNLGDICPSLCPQYHPA